MEVTPAGETPGAQHTLHSKRSYGGSGAPSRAPRGRSRGLRPVVRTCWFSYDQIHGRLGRLYPNGGAYEKFRLTAAGDPLLSCGCAQADATGVDYPQQVRYAVEDASEGHIAWGINGWQHTDNAFWNEGTAVNRTLLITPLRQVEDGALVAEINVPLGATIDFTFWITRSKDGLLKDAWDTRNYHVEAANVGPILVTGNLDHAPRLRKGNVLGHGWKLFLLCLLFVGGGILVLRLLGIETRPPAYHQKIILISVSLYVFHFLARTSILGIDVRHLSYASLGIGFSDLMYVLVLGGSVLAAGTIAADITVQAQAIVDLPCCGIAVTRGRSAQYRRGGEPRPSVQLSLAVLLRFSGKHGSPKCDRRKCIVVDGRQYRRDVRRHGSARAAHDCGAECLESGKGPGLQPFLRLLSPWLS